MRVLFLDFDGVLNSVTYLDEAASVKHGGVEAWSRSQINPKAVAIVNDVLESTGDPIVNSVVVVSSSWRHAHKRSALQRILDSRGFTGRIAGVTPSLLGNANRATEIALWLGRRPDVTSFAIVDDSHAAGILNGDRFVCTDPKVGITKEDGERLKAVLRRDL